MDRRSFFRRLIQTTAGIAVAMHTDLTNPTVTPGYFPMPESLVTPFQLEPLVQPLYDFYGIESAVKSNINLFEIPKDRWDSHW